MNQSDKLSGRLPERPRLGTMAVALEGEIRNREAGVARLKREKLREVGSKRLWNCPGLEESGPSLQSTLEWRERMATVVVNQGESIESALRRFKRKVMSEEIIKDAKKHSFFMSRGQKAKLKSALARKRNKRKQRPMRPRTR